MIQPVQQPNPSTSLLRAVGPTLQVNWLARAWKSSAGLRTLLWLKFGILIALIAVAICFKAIGVPGVAWTIGTGLLITAIVVGLPFALGAIILAWLAGAIRRQAGGEPWFSAEDGFEGGYDYVKKILEAFKNFLFYIPLVFFGIGFFRVEDNLLVVIPFIGISLALIVHYAGTGGSFFRGIVVLCYTLIVLWFLGTWIPAVAERQQQFGQWWSLKVSRNKADTAGDSAAADRHAKDVAAADACFRKLKAIARPTREDMDRCEALRNNVGNYVYKNAAEQARAESSAQRRQARIDAAAQCWKLTNEHSRPEDLAKCEALDQTIDPPATAVVSPSSQRTGERDTVVAPARTAPTDDPTCTKLDKLYEFDPKRYGNYVAGGVLQAGHYQVKATGASQEDVVIHAWGHALPVENGIIRISTAGTLPIALGMQNGRTEPVRVEIKQCGATRT